MGTLRAQFSEAFRKLEEAAEAIRSLTEEIRAEIGEEQSVPLFRSKEELISRLFPDGSPLENLNGELQKGKSKYEARKTDLRDEIERSMAKVHMLENECNSIDKRCRRIEEIYEDLFGPTTSPMNPIDAGKAYKDLERVLSPYAKGDKDILA